MVSTKEIVTAIMMLYKNMKALVHFFDSVTAVLQGDTLAQYWFISA